MSGVLNGQRTFHNRSRSGTENTLSSSETSVKGSNESGNHKLPNNEGTMGNYKKNRQNLVLSTSFISTKKLESAPPSPASPLQGRFPRNSVSKALLGIKSEINQLQQQLVQTKKNKKETEMLRDSAPSEIYKGEYSTDHLQKHSMRIRANTQIRELDKSMKKTEKQISDLKMQLEQAKKVNETANKASRLNIRHSNSSSGLNEAINNDAMKESPQFEASTADNLVQSFDSTQLTDDTGKINHETGGIQEENDSDLESEIQSQTKLEAASKPSPERKHASDELPITTNIETATWLISDFMQSLQDTNLTAEYVVKKANGLVALLKEHPEIRRNLVLSSFMGSIQSLLLSEDKTIVSSAYRICRYLIDSAEFTDWLIKLRLDAFIVISLAKDNSFQFEREQALRLVRSFSDFHARIPKSIIQALISCIEKQDDSLRNMALETLLELCFLNPQVVNECHGMCVFESMLRDYSLFPLASIILDAILQLMSKGSTRQYFLDDFNISVLFTIFSDSNTKSTLNVEKMQNGTLLISKALRNFNGLMLFSMNNFQPLRELLSFFQVPLCAPYLIDIFLDVLRIKKISYGGPRNSFKLTPSHFFRESMLINQYIALVVLIMFKANFVGCIGKLLNRYEEEDTNATLLAKARYLLSEYMNLAMNLLSEDTSFANEILPFYKKTYYDETFEFGRMSYAMNKKRNTLGMAAVDVGKNVLNISQNIKQTTIGRKVDDLEFRRMVYDSKVLQTKNFSSWNWSVIQELLEGPLLNSKQLDELVKSTKFIRRLLIFYRPMRLRFSNVNKGSRLSQRYIQVGCQFFRMLTSTSIGTKILADDTKIIPQLAYLLFRSMEGDTTDNIINANTLNTKVVGGYFKFIGVLTQSLNGITYLKKWSFFTVIYKMFENSYPICLNFLLLVLPELDLRYSGHCRTIMGKALVYPDENIRIKATEYLGEKLKQLYNNTNTSANEIDKMNDLRSLQRYFMEMLTRQLYDLSPKVVAVADQALYDCIVTEEFSIKMGSSLRTSLRQMVFIRSPIVFELMATSYGFQLLDEINFIQEERNSWLERKNTEYVSLVENFLSSSDYSSHFSPLKRLNQIKRLPHHFYESLAKTENGIALIGKSDDLIEFINVIKRFKIELDNESEQTIEDITAIKSALWCVGYIGSTELGVGLLDNYSLMEDIIQLAYKASETTVRFTAFLTLGLTSKTKEGCEILDEMGWNCCFNVQGAPMGITYPAHLDWLLSYNEKKWSSIDDYKDENIEFDLTNGDIIDSVPLIELNLEHLLKEKNFLENTLDDCYIQDLVKSTEKQCLEESLLQRNEFDENDLVEKVLNNVSKLGNHILSNSAIKEITEMNKEYGSKFLESEIVFTKVMDMMSLFRFKPHVRKFLCGLFINKKALSNIIKNDRKPK